MIPDQAFCASSQPASADFALPVLDRVVTREAVVRLQREMEKLPQVELPTEHHFADGMYCRVLFRPAGTLIVGKVHRKEHLYIVCHGTIRVTTDEGVKEIVGPKIIVSSPGTKRAVLALTDATCLTVHRTDSRDVEEIERELIEPEEGKRLFGAGNKLIDPVENDRKDYELFISQCGIPRNVIVERCMNEADQIPMPPWYDGIVIEPSEIHGCGVITTRDFGAGEVIALAGIEGKRTPVGRFTNHSANPNARMSIADHRIYLIATRAIKNGEEATTNYRETAQAFERIWP